MTDHDPVSNSASLAERLAPIGPTVEPVATRFREAGYRLYLVGGIVRDVQLGRLSGFDIDFTTDARPKEIKQLVSPLASAVWTQGEKFGTIGASVNGESLEITTHRAERYDPDSRKPVVSFGDDLREDLSRRDFTINAMAIEVPGNELHDPFGGAGDLASGLLRTPLSPKISFTDDPLRMLRAARFVSRFGLAVAPEVMTAAVELARRIKIVSVERVADELERLLAVTDPTPGFDFLRQTGLLSLAVVDRSDLQEALACRLASAGSPEDSILVRRAGLLWGTDVGSVLRRLRYSNQDRKETVALVDAVRRWVEEGHSTLADGRRLLNRIKQVEAPRRLAANLIDHYDGDAAMVASANRLILVLGELEAADDVGPYRSPLSGSDIMRALDVPPGPIVGQAEKMLRAHRLDNGPFSADEAVELLQDWYKED